VRIVVAGLLTEPHAGTEGLPKFGDLRSQCVSWSGDHDTTRCALLTLGRENFITTERDEYTVPSLDFNHDGVAFDPYGQCRLSNCRAELMLASSHIELPAMPRAGDDAAGHFALRERPALMWTDAIECVECAFDVEKSDDALPNHDLLAGSRRAVGNVGDLNPLTHAILCHCLADADGAPCTL
jgi:hypothetical protein